MPTVLKSSHRAMQLTLFRPTRNEPVWESMPIEVQQQVLRLLARMLRERVARRCGDPAPREHRDE
ncbi:hypothetical protein [Microbacterium sp. P5_E9]|jgi:hypothetical protein